jgi:hypothetical protein
MKERGGLGGRLGVGRRGEKQRGEERRGANKNRAGGIVGDGQRGSERGRRRNSVRDIVNGLGERRRLQETKSV